MPWIAARGAIGMDAKSDRRSAQDQFSSAAAAPTETAGGASDMERTRRIRNVWFAVAAASTLLGTWGVIGGWYFGLPVGGEVRSDLFAERGWQVGDFFTSIPHPDLAGIPCLPQLSGACSIRPKFADSITWRERRFSSVPAATGPKSAVEPKSKSENVVPRPGPQFGQAGRSRPIGNLFSIGAFAAQLEPPPSKVPTPSKVPSPNAPPAVLPPQNTIPPPAVSPVQAPPRPPSAVFSPPAQMTWLAYETNIRSSTLVVTGARTPATDRVPCLSIKDSGAAAASFSCVQVDFDFPLNRPVTVAFDRFVKLGTANVATFNAAGEIVAPSIAAAAALDVGGPPSDKFLLGIADVPRTLGATSAYAVTIGSQGQGDQPVIWFASFGAIYKLLPRTGQLFSITKVAVPTPNSIGLIFFASSTHGWAYTDFPDGQEGVSTYPALFQTYDGGSTWKRLWYRWLPAPWTFVAFLVGLVAFDRGSRAQNELRPVSQKAHIADHGVCDDPIGLDDVDALGLVPIAKSLARFLRNVETKPTVTIAVTGPWGSGKTSLMNLVREELAAQNVRAVWFNAWHHQKEDNLLAALLASIRAQAVPPWWTLSGLTYRVRIAVHRVTSDPGRSFAFAAFAAIAAFLVTQFLPGALQSIQYLISASGKLSAEAVKSIGLSTGGLGVLIYSVSEFWDWFKPLKSVPADLLASLSERSKAKDLSQQLSFRYRFAAEFATFCDTLRLPPHPGLVIFVDDLDRCAPRQTVDVLEAINFVTNAGKCFVVFGLDEDKVKAAIADIYKDMTFRLELVDRAAHRKETAEQEAEEVAEEKAIDLVNFASNYLEKLIHLVVPVPRSRKETVDVLLGVRTVRPPDAAERRRQRLYAKAFDFAGTVLVVALLAAVAWFAVDIGTRTLASLAATLEVANSATAPTSRDAAVPAPSGGAAGGGGSAGASSAPATPPGVTAAGGETFLSPDRLGQLGLLSTDPAGAVPPSAFVLAFVVLIAVVAYQFVPRFFPDPIVNDSPEFKKALEIWSYGISLQRETPRAVKRFVNRLRFMAMRLRDIESAATQSGFSAPLDEPTLVTFSSIDDLNPNALGLPRDRLKEPSGRMTVIRAGLKDFETEFHLDPYANPEALNTYRLLAGLVEERGGRDTDV